MALKKFGKRGDKSSEIKEPKVLPEHILMSHRAASNRQEIISTTFNTKKHVLDTVIAQHGKPTPEQQVRECMDFIIDKAVSEQKTVVELLWEHRADMSHIGGPAYRLFGLEYAPVWYRVMSGYIVFMSRIDVLHKELCKQFTDAHLLDAASTDFVSVTNAILHSPKAAAQDLAYIPDFISLKSIEGDVTYAKLFAVMEDAIVTSLQEDGRGETYATLGGETFALKGVVLTPEETTLARLEQVRAVQKEKETAMLMTERSEEEEKTIFCYALTCIVDEGLGVEEVLEELRVTAEWLYTVCARSALVEGIQRGKLVKLRQMLKPFLG